MKIYLNFLVAGMVCIFILFIIIGIQFDKTKTNEFTHGIVTFQEGVSSIPLDLGTEQMIYFDKHLGVKFYLEKNEMSEDDTRHVVGNIDFVVIYQPIGTVKQKDTWKQELVSVLLRHQFDLRYHVAADGKTMEVLSLNVSNLPVSAYTKIWEQSSQFTKKKYFTYSEPLTGKLMVDFSNTLWNIAPIFTWQYEITIDEQKHVILALKPLEQTKPI